ncbi:MAG: hypothetical protein ACE5J9_10735 [Methanosarcinales archaeon]
MSTQEKSKDLEKLKEIANKYGIKGIIDNKIFEYTDKVIARRIKLYERLSKM